VSVTKDNKKTVIRLRKKTILFTFFKYKRMKVLS